MLRRIVLLACSLVTFTACERSYEQNPDPNHTHADFSVWVLGEQVDFSGPEFMSGLSTDEHTHDEEGEYLHEYLHLHDGNGHVLHSHKPGQVIGEFFESLGVQFSKQGLNLCVKIADRPVVCEDEAMHRNWVMIVNGERKPFFDTEYVLTDMDKILIELPVTEPTEDMQEVWTHWSQMTDDACLYSKTCPWRGDPPTENCIADPAVPCVETE